MAIRRNRRGIELDVSYNPMRNWQIMLGYAHATKAETVSSTTPARVGLPLAAFPKDVISLWTKYDVRSGPLNGFSFGGGMRDSGSARFASDQKLTVRMPAYRTFDFLAQYRFKVAEKDAFVQLNVKNIFDKEYREGNMGGWGDPLNFMLSFGTKF